MSTDYYQVLPQKLNIGKVYDSLKHVRYLGFDTTLVIRSHIYFYSAGVAIRVYEYSVYLTGELDAVKPAWEKIHQYLSSL
jgi:hypothetical protein